MEDFPEAMRIAGVDLAWGDRRSDGVWVLEVNRQRARVLALGLPQGDDELLAFLDQHLGGARAFIAMDAPVVCRNHTGASTCGWASNTPSIPSSTARTAISMAWGPRPPTTTPFAPSHGSHFRQAGGVMIQPRGPKIFGRL